MQFYPHAYITIPYSVIEASIAVSQIIAAPVAAALLQLSGTFSLAGWQWLFLTEGLVTLVLAGVLRWRLPRNVVTASFLTEDDKIWLLDHLQAGSGDSRSLDPVVQGLRSQAEKAHKSGELAAVVDGSGNSSSDRLADVEVDICHDVKGALLLPGSSSSSSLRHLQHQPLGHSVTDIHRDHHDDSSKNLEPSHVKQQHASSTGGFHQPLSAAAVRGGAGHAPEAAADHMNSSGKLTAWQQIASTFANKLILYLMVLKALKV